MYRTLMDWNAFYHRVYDILVRHAGAHEHYRDAFVQYAMREDRPMTEFRFQGNLGFGGKLWRNGGRLYVSCYREDSTPARVATIEGVNRMLAEITPEGGVHGPPSHHAEQATA